MRHLRWRGYPSVLEATSLVSYPFQMSADARVAELAESLMLGALLERVRQRWGTYELLDHWQQGDGGWLLRKPVSQA